MELGPLQAHQNLYRKAINFQSVAQSAEAKNPRIGRDQPHSTTYTIPAVTNLVNPSRHLVCAKHFGPDRLFTRVLIWQRSTTEDDVFSEEGTALNIAAKPLYSVLINIVLKHYWWPLTEGWKAFYKKLLAR
jgi:hypothetical protein